MADTPGNARDKILEAAGLTPAARRQELKETLTGFFKAVTTDVPGLLMDFADKISGDTKVFGERDRSAQLFEQMTGVKSTGSVMESVGGMISPGGAAKAIAIPALLMKDFTVFNRANKLLKGGVPGEEVFQRTGIYPDPVTGSMRSIIDDSAVALKEGSIVQRNPGIAASEGPRVSYHVPWDASAKLDEVIDHPELFALVPSLKDVTVRNQFGGYKYASFDPTNNTIRMGSQPSEKEFLSVLLHETQHAVQNEFGMIPGGNTKMFTENKNAVEAAKGRVKDMKDRAFAKLKEAAKKQKENIYNPSTKFQNSTEWRQLDMAEEAQQKLFDIEADAFSRYESLGGEAEARMVQRMFESRDPAAYPPALYDVPLDSLIADPSKLPKLDQDPVIQAIIKSVLRPTATSGPLTK